MDPFGGKVMHYDSISVIVSRLTFFFDNFVICFASDQILSARATALPLCHLYGVFVILVRLQISQFRSLGK